MIPVLRIVLCVGLLTIADASLAQVRPATDSRVQEALTLEQHGKNTEAEAVWREVLKADPQSAEACGHLGLLEARQGHYKEAVPLYRKALKLGPDVPGLRLNLGLALFKGGDLKGAIQEFDPLLKTQPGNEQLTTLIGMAHYGLAEYTAAVPYLREAAAKDANSSPLLLALAHSCLFSKQYQCVLDAYHQILMLNPDSAEADMLAGDALDEMKDMAGATKMFRAAIEADPKTPNAHFDLAYLLWIQKQYPEAASEFKAELVNDPNHIPSMLYLADTDIQLNQKEDARPLLEKVVRATPSYALAHLDLGIVYSEAGRNQDALRELTAAEKLTPDDMNAHWRLGRLYRSMGMKDEAMAEFAKTSSLDKAHNDENFKKISDAGMRHGPPPTPSTPPDK